MEHLSEIEQAVRPMFPGGPETVRPMVLCPRPRYEDPPEEPRLKALAEEHLADVVAVLQRVIALQRRQAPFQPEALSLLLQADKMIPGAGIHHSVVVGPGSYVYPFDAEYEAVRRPLRYALSELGQAYLQTTSARYAVQTAGGHLEGCMKIVCGNRHRTKPLGSLLKSNNARERIGADAVEPMIDFTSIGVNPAKHDYANDRGPAPLFLFDDALYAYYLARRFGATALSAVGELQPVVDAVVQASEKRAHFRGAPPMV